MFTDYVRLLVVSQDGQCVLMNHFDSTHEWDLPYYVRDIHPDNFVRCLWELHEELGIDQEHPVFTGVTDILGDHIARERGLGQSNSSPGYARLLLLETHDYSFELPVGWQWKDTEFLESLKESERCYNCGFESSVRRAALFLRKSPELMEELWQPRHRPRWYDRMCAWLEAVAEREGADVTGAVLQHRVSAWTTILRVESSQGSFYLKAPTAGTQEVKVTQALYKKFPSLTLDVAGVSDDLANFVSREFDLAYDREEENYELFSVMTNRIASLQLGSIDHLDELIAAGCPVLDPDKLNEIVDEWADDEFLNVRIAGFMRRFREEQVPQVKLMLSRLVENEFPLTITHGDLSKRNIGFKKDEAGNEKMILFDWQYTAVSHPFFDFHEMKDKLDDEQIEAYLRMWSKYAPLERCREVFEEAYPLGWLLKAYTSFNCLRASKPEEIPMMINIFADFLDAMKLSMERSEAYQTNDRNAANEKGSGMC